MMLPAVEEPRVFAHAVDVEPGPFDAIWRGERGALMAHEVVEGTFTAGDVALLRRKAEPDQQEAWAEDPRGIPALVVALLFAERKGPGMSAGYALLGVRVLARYVDEAWSVEPYG